MSQEPKLLTKKKKNAAKFELVFVLDLGIPSLKAVRVEFKSTRTLAYVMDKSSDIVVLADRFMVGQVLVNGSNQLPDLWSHPSLTVQDRVRKVVPDKTLKHGNVDALVLQIVHRHAWPQLLVVSNQDKVLDSGCQCCQQMRFQCLRGFFTDQDSWPENTQQVVVLGLEIKKRAHLAS